MNKIIVWIGLLFVSVVNGFASGDDRFIEQLTLASGQVVVVSEGDNEPRSIGSYSVRLYSGAMAEFPTDEFVTGLIKERDGYIEKITTRDLDGDGRDELLIMIRSAGSGSYLSAHAFSVADKSLAFLAAVDGLPADADPVPALSKLIAPRD